MCIDDSCVCEKCCYCSYDCPCPDLCKHNVDNKKYKCEFCEADYEAYIKKIGPGCLDITTSSDRFRVTRPCISYPNCKECKNIRKEE